MELGELELEVLRVIRSLGEATPGAIHREVRKTRDVAYTSVTTTLYRLVDKDLVAMRKESEKRIFYRVKDGRAYRKVMAAMVDQIVGTFGGAAVSYLLENPEALPHAQRHELEARVTERRKKEPRHE